MSLWFVRCLAVVSIILFCGCATSPMPTGSTASTGDVPEANDPEGNDSSSNDNEAPIQSSPVAGRWDCFMQMPLMSCPGSLEIDSEGSLKSWFFDSDSLDYLVSQHGAYSHLGSDSILLNENIAASARTDWVENITPGGNTDTYQLISAGTIHYDADTRAVVWEEETTIYDVWLTYEAYSSINMTLSGTLSESGETITWANVEGTYTTFSSFAAECCGAKEPVTIELNSEQFPTLLESWERQ